MIASGLPQWHKCQKKTLTAGGAAGLVFHGRERSLRRTQYVPDWSVTGCRIFSHPKDFRFGLRHKRWLTSLLGMSLWFIWGDENSRFAQTQMYFASLRLRRTEAGSNKSIAGPC